MALLLLLLAIVAIVLFYKWCTEFRDYFDKRNIPYVKTVPVFGVLFDAIFARQPVIDSLKKMYNDNKQHKICGFFNFRKPALIIHDPDLIKQMIIKDFEYFPDHEEIIDEYMHPLLGKSLMSLKGNQWRDMRATLSPMFTGNKMRQMFGLISDCAQQMSQHFLNESEQKPDKLVYEMKALFSRFANDVIATCAFGIKVDSFKHDNNEFFLAGQSLSDFNGVLQGLKYLGYKLFPKLLRKLNVEMVDVNTTNYLKNIILDTVQIRTEKNIVRPDLIHLLIQAKSGMLRRTDEKETDGFATVEEYKLEKSKVKEKLTDDELVAQCLLFFQAGFETIATLLAFAAYELATNPDIQDKLYDHIKETHDNLNGVPLTYESVLGMKYLDMVISEALRKWPTLIMNERICVKDYKCDFGNGEEFLVEKGIQIFTPVIGLHHDPDYYPNPDRFDPERFSDENKHNIHMGAYMPFGIGPRNCIGSRFALVELKTVLYHLMLTFKFEVTEKTQIPLKLSNSPLTVVSEKGIWLEFKKRN